jgi:hypothetical protein
MPSKASTEIIAEKTMKLSRRGCKLRGKICNQAEPSKKGERN